MTSHPYRKTYRVSVVADRSAVAEIELGARGSAIVTDLWIKLNSPTSDPGPEFWLEELDADGAVVMVVAGP